MPATVALPGSSAAGLLLGNGLSACAGGARPFPRPGTVPLTGLVAVVAVWAGAVLALAAVQLNRSDSALAEGDLPAAAAAARAAEAIEPWSAAPALRLAEIEQAAGNLDAARRRAEQAVRLIARRLPRLDPAGRRQRRARRGRDRRGLRAAGQLAGSAGAVRQGGDPADHA